MRRSVAVSGCAPLFSSELPGIDFQPSASWLLKALTNAESESAPAGNSWISRHPFVVLGCRPPATPVHRDLGRRLCRCAGQFEQAIRAAEAAETFALLTDQKELAIRNHELLSQYAAGKSAGAPNPP
jgi:hypothetical protein